LPAYKHLLTETAPRPGTISRQASVISFHIYKAKPLILLQKICATDAQTSNAAKI
jgi:hypothetical protein